MIFKRLAFFNTHEFIRQNDHLVFDAIEKELKRQQTHIELIASENIVSKNVLMAQGSVLTNKYAEGYPNKRYYGGCEYVDEVEKLAIERAKLLFGCSYANVQPHSGAQANQAVFLALLKPSDTFLGMSLDAGGHLTHGSKASKSGKWFNAVGYGIDSITHLIDYDNVEKLALEYNPKLIIAGGSAYSRFIDFKRFREIADKVGAILMVDMAHYAGLIAAGIYPSPIPFAHITTSTTHKTLRCSRGGLILTNDEILAKKIDSAVFPGLQGGPLMHAIAGKAVGFGEALQDDFKEYAIQVVKNAKILAQTLIEGGLKILSNGTDSHLMIVDLRPLKITGKDAEHVLWSNNLTCNKNSIVNDPEPPSITSGIRLGTPAGTSRGFKEKEFKKIGQIIIDILRKYKNGNNNYDNEKNQVIEMCEQFPIY